MPTVLHVIDDLTCRGPARQLSLLTDELLRVGWDVRVCTLGRDTPWAMALGKNGVAVTALRRVRPFDVWPFLALRRLVQGTGVDVVHAWGPLALRALTTVARPPARLVASAVLPTGRPGWLDRRLLARAAGVLAFGDAEADRYRQLGLADRLIVVRPAVAPFATVTTAEHESLALRGRVLLGVGPLHPHKGFHDAVWALDILHYLYADQHQK